MEKHVDQTLSGWFCFVQTEDGKIVAVQHNTNESDIAVNIKKSIAAAFQANFKGTEEEIESDLQSDHVAHYRYCWQYCILTIVTLKFIVDIILCI